MLAVNIDRKLQQRLRGLPSVLVLRFWRYSRVVTGIVVVHEVVPRNIVRRTVALLKRVEAQTENRQQTIHKRTRRELVLGGAVLQNFGV